MSTPLPGFPPDRASAELERGAASIVLDEEIYALEALYGAAYAFLDRCFVLIDRAQPGRFRVTLTPKTDAGGDAANLRALVGEFANELLSCAWRQRLAVDNRAAIEATTLQAIAGAMGPPSLDDLASFDFGEKPFDDPLGIAVPWEEKYGKKPGGDSGEGS
jgi:His-Xaa-Ser system protein HxsD